jgi:very-short-patch-repair endonuclease
MPKFRVTKNLREKARSLRISSTDAEKKLWRLLRSRQFASIKFRRQAPIGRWVVDFVAFEQKIVVEADGGQHAEAAKDQKRDTDLAARGFRILRFWNHDILKNPEGVLEALNEALKDSPSPAPRFARATLSHQGRG